MSTTTGPTVSIDLTEAMTIAALRTVLLTMVGSSVEVIRAETNKVPEPVGLDYVLMTPISRVRLATNITNWADGFFDTPPLPGARCEMQETMVTVQLDVHGPASAETTQIITTLCRSEITCNEFTATGLAVQMLYAADAKQSPFMNAEQQMELRWTIDVALQANPIITTAQQFAGALFAGVIEVDAIYPPK